MTEPDIVITVKRNQFTDSDIVSPTPEELEVIRKIPDGEETLKKLFNHYAEMGYYYGDMYNVVTTTKVKEFLWEHTRDDFLKDLKTLVEKHLVGLQTRLQLEVA